MHGSGKLARELAKQGDCNVAQLEASSGRSALHKACFWNHLHLIDFLVNDCKVCFLGCLMFSLF